MISVQIDEHEEKVIEVYKTDQLDKTIFKFLE